METQGTERRPGEDMNTYKARLIADHVCKSLGSQGVRWRCTTDATRLCPPVIIGLQGPQGVGKTTITTQLKAELSQRKWGTRTLHVVVFSIDDLYLTHRELDELKRTHPHNRLLHGRGQPGTHDLKLGHRCLDQLRNINGSFAESRAAMPPVALPIFDKGLFDGEGDRSTETVRVEPDVDIVLFEGWCLGFAPLGRAELERRYHEAAAKHKDGAPSADGRRAPYFLQHSLESLIEIDERLQEYADKWYRFINAFVQLRPSAGLAQSGTAGAQPSGLDNVFRWRLQAEHAMKAANGGKGMTDEQVRAFVERYMPGYELWGEGVTDAARPWHKKGLRIDIGPEREVISVSHF